MSEIKKVYELAEACYQAIEAHYAAADKMQEILELSRELDTKMYAHMLVLQSQSKMFAGKLKQYVKEYLGDQYDDYITTTVHHANLGSF